MQDLVISAKDHLLPARTLGHARWTLDPGTVAGQDRGHFGPELRRFVLMQYHQGQSAAAPAGDIHHSFPVGVAISKRQLQRLLTDRQEDFVSRSPGCFARRFGDIAVCLGTTIYRLHAMPGRTVILHTDRQ